MKLLFTELNTDQLSELAKFCFDIAKVGAVSFLLPAVLPDSRTLSAISMVRGLIIASLSIYLGLLLLRSKEVVS